MAIIKLVSSILSLFFMIVLKNTDNTVLKVFLYISAALVVLRIICDILLFILV